MRPVGDGYFSFLLLSEQGAKGFINASCFNLLMCFSLFKKVVYVFAYIALKCVFV